MSCCDSPFWPDGLKKPPYVRINDENRGRYKEISTALLANKTNYEKLPETYHSCPVARIIILAAIIIGTTTIIMAMQGTLSAFPQNFLRFVHQINWIYVGIGAAVLTVLSVGAAIVIHRVTHRQKYPITNHDIGKLSGDSHWVPAYYTVEDSPDDRYLGYLDTSTLVNGTGEALMYPYKVEGVQYPVIAELFALMPLYMVGVIAFNLLKLVVTPLFIGGKLLSYRFTGPPPNVEERFRASDIPDEMGQAVTQIAKAKFYTLAMMYACLRAFSDPQNGKKLIAYIEWDWNQDKTRAQAYWSVGGPQRLFDWSGWLTRRNFFAKNSSFVGPGCMHPIAVAHFENRVIVPEQGKSLTRAVNPQKGERYNIYTAQVFIANHDKLVTDLTEQCHPNELTRRIY